MRNSKRVLGKLTLSAALWLALLSAGVGHSQPAAPAGDSAAEMVYAQKPNPDFSMTAVLGLTIIVVGFIYAKYVPSNNINLSIFLVTVMSLMLLAGKISAKDFTEMIKSNINPMHASSSPSPPG